MTPTRRAALDALVNDMQAAGFAPSQISAAVRVACGKFPTPPPAPGGADIRRHLSGRGLP